MLPRVLALICVIVAKSSLPNKAFVDYNGVRDIPGKPLNMSPIIYDVGAAHCKRECFTNTTCDCAVFSLAAGSCQMRTHCRDQTVQYGVGGDFTVFVKLPDSLPRYKQYKDNNTYSGRGSTNLASDMREMVVSHEVCLARCSVNDECDCVVYKTQPEAAYQDGGCWLRKDCNPDKFMEDVGFSVYVKQRGTEQGPSAKELAAKLAEARRRYEHALSKLTDAEAHNAQAMAQAAKRLNMSKDQLEKAKKQANQASQMFLNANKSLNSKLAAAEEKAEKEKKLYATKKADAAKAMAQATKQLNSLKDQLKKAKKKEDDAKKQEELDAAEKAKEAARLAEAKAKKAEEQVRKAENAVKLAEEKAKNVKKATRDAALDQEEIEEERDAAERAEKAAWLAKAKAEKAEAQAKKAEQKAQKAEKTAKDSALDQDELDKEQDPAEKAEEAEAKAKTAKARAKKAEQKAQKAEKTAKDKEHDAAEKAEEAARLARAKAKTAKARAKTAEQKAQAQKVEKMKEEAKTAGKTVVVSAVAGIMLTGGDAATHSGAVSGGTDQTKKQFRGCLDKLLKIKFHALFFVFTLQLVLLERAGFWTPWVEVDKYFLRALWLVCSLMFICFAGLSSYLILARRKPADAEKEEMTTTPSGDEQKERAAETTPKQTLKRMRILLTLLHAPVMALVLLFLGLETCDKTHANMTSTTNTTTAMAAGNSANKHTIFGSLLSPQLWISLFCITLPLDGFLQILGSLLSPELCISLFCITLPLGGFLQGDVAKKTSHHLAISLLLSSLQFALFALLWHSFGSKAWWSYVLVCVMILIWGCVWLHYVRQKIKDMMDEQREDSHTLMCSQNLLAEVVENPNDASEETNNIGEVIMDIMADTKDIMKEKMGPSWSWACEQLKHLCPIMADTGNIMKEKMGPSWSWACEELKRLCPRPSFQEEEKKEVADEHQLTEPANATLLSSTDSAGSLPCLLGNLEKTLRELEDDHQKMTQKIKHAEKQTSEAAKSSGAEQELEIHLLKNQAMFEDNEGNTKIIEFEGGTPGFACRPSPTRRWLFPRAKWPTKSVVVSHVEENQQAEKLGVQPSWTLKSINGTQVRDMETAESLLGEPWRVKSLLAEQLSRRSKGSDRSAEAASSREEAQEEEIPLLTNKVTFEDNEGKTRCMEFKGGAPGFACRPTKGLLFPRAKWPTTSVVVSHVDPNQQAETLGVQPSWTLKSINGTQVRDLETAESLLGEHWRVGCLSPCSGGSNRIGFFRAQVVELQGLLESKQISNKQSKEVDESDNKLLAVSGLVVCVSYFLSIGAASPAKEMHSLILFISLWQISFHRDLKAADEKNQQVGEHEKNEEKGH